MQAAKMLVSADLPGASQADVFYVFVVLLRSCTSFLDVEVQMQGKLMIPSCLSPRAILHHVPRSPENSPEPCINAIATYEFVERPYVHHGKDWRDQALKPYEILSKPDNDPKGPSTQVRSTWLAPANENSMKDSSPYKTQSLHYLGTSTCSCRSPGLPVVWGPDSTQGKATQPIDILEEEGEAPETTSLGASNRTLF